MAKFIRVHKDSMNGNGVTTTHNYYINVEDISHIDCAEGYRHHNCVIYLKTTVYDKDLKTFVNATLEVEETVDEINTKLGFRGV
jgi:hypothetical protein